MHFGETESRIIALIGAKESGKSNYISVLINELKTKIAAQFGASFSEVDDQTMERYNRDFRRYTYVERVAITTTRSANADPNVRTPLIYRLDMEKDNLIGSNIQTTYVVFFDTAGEDLVSGENMERVTKYIAKAQGIIFLIDPLQILSLQDLLRQKNIRLPVENTDPQSIMIRTANLIRDEHRMPLNKKIKTPIAFTFSKIDAVLPLMDPSTPVRLDPEHYGFFDLEDFERVNTSMCTYLDKWVGPGFNMFPKLHFENYAYFGLSALGSAPDPDTNEIVKGVVPHRIADPFLWILYQLKLINETRRSQAPLRFF
jgi:GTPase SAR1 family protein